MKSIWKLASTVLGTVVVSDIMACILIPSVGVFVNKIWVLMFMLFLLVFLIYAMLIYSKVWDYAVTEPNRVHTRQQKKFLAKGFVAGLIADIPFIALYVALVISFYQSEQFYKQMYFIYIFVNMTFNFFVVRMTAIPWLLFLFLIPLPLISGVSYLLGYHQISLTEKIIYKKQSGK